VTVQETGRTRDGGSLEPAAIAGRIRGGAARGPIGLDAWTARTA
jgi:hypothetical protein